MRSRMARRSCHLAGWQGSRDAAPLLLVGQQDLVRQAIELQGRSHLLPLQKLRQHRQAVNACRHRQHLIQRLLRNERSRHPPSGKPTGRLPLSGCPLTAASRSPASPPVGSHCVIELRRHMYSTRQSHPVWREALLPHATAISRAVLTTAAALAAPSQTCSMDFRLFAGTTG